MQLLQQSVQPVLMKDRHQCGFDSFRFSHSLNTYIRLRHKDTNFILIHGVLSLKNSGLPLLCGRERNLPAEIQ